MPQRDDKIGVYFGRIHPAVWHRIEDHPGATVEEAIGVLAQAVDAGRKLHYPTSRKVGLRKKLWLPPETVATLKRLSHKTGIPNTPLILAALDLLLGPIKGLDG